ncbi:MAG: cell wall hydrolase [Candidatus Contendobacter sp.]|nr:cell wall hydrolase [Candidatus Contendobacter sp.]
MAINAVLSVPFAYRPADLIALARTLWGEARGEPREGQIAIAWCIRNRAENPGWWSRQQGDGIPDDTIEAVCRDPAQFACWWDAQAPKVRTRSAESLAPFVDLAREVLDGTTPDPTGGADHYHTIARPAYAKFWPPLWAAGHRGVAIGSHLFYRLGLGGGAR